MKKVNRKAVFDDIKLGLGLASIASLSLKAGIEDLARESQDDAEGCYSRAAKSAEKMDAQDQAAAANELQKLRMAIEKISLDPHPALPRVQVHAARQAQQNVVVRKILKGIRRVCIEIAKWWHPKLHPMSVF